MEPIDAVCEIYHAAVEIREPFAKLPIKRDVRAAWRAV